MPPRVAGSGEARFGDGKLAAAAGQANVRLRIPGLLPWTVIVYANPCRRACRNLSEVSFFGEEDQLPHVEQFAESRNRSDWTLF